VRSCRDVTKASNKVRCHLRWSLGSILHYRSSHGRSRIVGGRLARRVESSGKKHSGQDEIVAWHIARAANPENLIVTADKIVDGNVISMGALDFKYHRENNQIVCENERGIWKLTVKGNTLEGTLTLRDQTVLRHVALEKSKPRQE